MEGITVKFPKPIKMIFSIYYNAAHNLEEFRIQKYLFFIPFIALNGIELSKCIFNGLVNQTFYRLLLSDFICSFKSQQILYNFSFAVTYASMIKLSLTVLSSCTQKTPVLNEEYLSFLNLDTEKKLRKHQFRREVSKEYFSLVNFSIKFVIWNMRIFFTGICMGMIRVIYFAFYGLPLNFFILCTIPTSILSAITFVMFYYVTCTFYLVYFLNCIFLNKKLKSLSLRASLLQLDSSSKWKFNFNALQSLSQLNQILKQIHHAQRDIDHTISAHFVGISIVGYTFPFIFFFGGDDLISYGFCVILYVQGMIFSIYSIIGASCYLNYGFEHYRNFLFSITFHTKSTIVRMKLENFLSLHRNDDTFLGFNYLNLFNYSNYWLLKYLLESFSMILLLQNGFIFSFK